MLHIPADGRKTSGEQNYTTIVLYLFPFARFDLSKQECVPFHCKVLVGSTEEHVTETYEVSYLSVPTSNLYVGMNVILASE
jgi:hypothetical protein